ncbi:succinylglutamate desuccinylase/aspartoacylase family protein [Limnohabitans sp. Rim8]|jgi:predicted deacylase|uniref:succinylglutamate desuccinylase/aspartoacylase domain-containing protein n=1 Tax=Limnohabitans sp. Rim8 TaxID=1100718 RepID=UPI0025E853BE|nr:succinylglutamate desuccinylase/aspartoacylase family protein [Limnohabitans sp. Rim8]
MNPVDIPPVPPVEIHAPDISRWREGNTGVPFVHLIDSGLPGPRVHVQALTHGNEICGAIAVDELLREGFQPRIGQLCVVFANHEAYARWDPQDPYNSRYVDEDMNRVWSDAALAVGETVEKRRARELQPFVDEADFILDIHSMNEDCVPLMVCGTLEKNARFAAELGMPAHLLLDTGHPAGLRMIERGKFGLAAEPERALLIECGQHWEAAAADVARDSLARFLGLTGLASPSWVQAQQRQALPDRQRLVRVTEPVVARSLDFHFLVPIVPMSTIVKAGTPIAQDGEHIWTSPYDDCVLIMPTQRRFKPGQTMVRLGRLEVI